MNRSHTTWALRLCWVLRLSQGLLLALITTSALAQITSEIVWQRCIGGSGLESVVEMDPTSDGGYICVGSGYSTDGDMIGSHGASDILVTKLASNGIVQWNRVLGGSLDDIGVDCIELQDGTIMVLGTTTSADGDVTENKGANDVWVIKLSPVGTIIWQHTYGGASIDLSGQIQESGNGGFIIWGATLSEDGDVIGYHSGTGAEDVWILKLDQSGAIEWSRALGGSSNDYGNMLLQTGDGGYLVLFNYIFSSDGDVSDYRGLGDIWLVKLSSSGNIEWSRTIGGSQLDNGVEIAELNGGEIILVGQTGSSDGDVSLNHGGTDVVLVKLSSAGTMLWERTYGGSLLDYSTDLLLSADGGYVLTGASSSNDFDLTNNEGQFDAWSVKVDANGTLQWQRSIGGSQTDAGTLMNIDSQGYLLSGQTFSSNGDVQGSQGNNDIWLVMLSETGVLSWQRCLGGSGADTGRFRFRTSDGGYVLFGQTTSNNGDVSGNHGGQDIWVVKLKVTEPTILLECALYVPNTFSPNSSGKNDSQCLYGTECIMSMSFGIYDRWGNKVFESTDPKACWDGTYNGQALDPAVFVYHLSAALTGGETVEKQGNITLVR